MENEVKKIEKMKDESYAEYILRISNIYNSKVEEFRKMESGIKKVEEIEKLSSNIRELDKIIHFFLLTGTGISQSQLQFCDGSVLSTDGKTVWIDSSMMKRKGN